MSIKIEDILNNVTEFIDCDGAEIEKVGGRYYLFILANRRSEGEWHKSNALGQYEPVSFDYVERQVISSGSTLTELNDDFLFYVKLMKAKTGIDGILLVLEKRGESKETLDFFREAAIQYQKFGEPN